MARCTRWPIRAQVVRGPAFEGETALYLFSDRLCRILQTRIQPELRRAESLILHDKNRVEMIHAARLRGQLTINFHGAGSSSNGNSGMHRHGALCPGRYADGKSCGTLLRFSENAATRSGPQFDIVSWRATPYRCPRRLGAWNLARNSGRAAPARKVSKFGHDSPQISTARAIPSLTRAKRR